MEIKLYRKPYEDPVRFESLMWNDHFVIYVPENHARLDPIFTKIPDCVSQETRCNAILLNSDTNGETPFRQFKSDMLVYRVHVREIVIEIER